MLGVQQGERAKPVAAVTPAERTSNSKSENEETGLLAFLSSGPDDLTTI